MTHAKQVFYPVLRYNDVAAAVAWLARMFQFGKGLMVNGPDGKVQFATMTFGQGTILLSSTPADDLRLASPMSVGSSTAAVHVVIENVDRHYAKTVAAGAEVVRPLEDTGHGSRDYNVRDLEGHIWAFSTSEP